MLSRYEHSESVSGFLHILLDAHFFHFLLLLSCSMLATSQLLRLCLKVRNVLHRRLTR